MKPPTKEQQAWIDSRPDNVKRVIEKCPPNTCHKNKDGNGHFRIYSYDEDKSGKVSLRIIHGKDSFLPGVMAFGIDPDYLVECGCDKWEPPTEAQGEQTQAYMDLMKATEGKEFKSSAAAWRWEQ